MRCQHKKCPEGVEEEEAEVFEAGDSVVDSGVVVFEVGDLEVEGEILELAGDLLEELELIV